MKRMTSQRLQPLTLQLTVVQTAGPERSAEFASCGRSGVLLARSHVVQPFRVRAGVLPWP